MSESINEIPSALDPKKKSRLNFLMVFFVVAIIPLIYVLLIFMSVPKEKIKILKTGYVEVLNKSDKGAERFKITSKRPKLWKALNQIPKTVIGPIVISEDWSFFEHEGVDFSQIKKAISESVVDGKKLRGASTISQQLVKNLFLSNERSFSRKLKEYFYTKELEQELSKKKILELYLNILHLGDGLYGVQKAAQFYFKRPLNQLSYREGAFLAMLLPNPLKYSQSFRQGKLTPFAREVVGKVLDKLVIAKKLSAKQAEQEKARLYNWEKMSRKNLNRKKQKTSVQNDNNREMGLEESRRRGTDPLNRAGEFRGGGKKVAKSIRKKFIDGSEFEERLKNDPEMQIDDSLIYDDDALIEDQSGFEAEFKVE